MALPPIHTPAFPGAQGYGASVTGGRGGRVLRVTRLDGDASVSGSLPWALAQTGPRIIVFTVSGVIEEDIEFSEPDVTIAGQTAPGAGITLHGRLTAEYGENSGNIIIRHVRIRPRSAAASGVDGDQHDALQMSTQRNIILDHVDISHGTDENVDLWGGAQQVTVQWSTITFPRTTGHPEGPPEGLPHNYCLLNSDEGSDGEDATRGGRITLHHNLFAHCRARNPALGNGPAEVINNVIYNPQRGFGHENIAAGDFSIMGNVYKAGAQSGFAPFVMDAENDPGPAPTRYFFADNRVVHDDFTGTLNNPFDDDAFLNEFDFAGSMNLQESQVLAVNFTVNDSKHLGVTLDTHTVAYERVLALSGTCPRDFVTELAVSETTDGTGVQRTLAIDSSSLMDGLTVAPAPLDTDADGIPDVWESSHGLDPNDANDSKALRPSGYAAIEEYVNELADSLCGVTPETPGTTGGSTTGTSAGASAGATTGSTTGSATGASNGIKAGVTTGTGKTGCTATGETGFAWMIAAVLTIARIRPHQRLSLRSNLLLSRKR